MSDAAARKLFEKALKAGQARDYRGSAELLTALLARTDAMPEALLFLGRARHALGETALAVDAFRLYLRGGGERAAGFFFLGRAYLAAGRVEAAISSLRRSAAADHNRAPTWALLGAACLKAKRTKAAAACLERAVTLAPDDERIHRGYLNALFARAVRLIARGEADLARQMLGFVLENGLDGTAVRLWRARALRELGRFPEALADCEAALDRSPDDLSIRWLRAGLLLAAGRQAEAAREFDSIRAENPGLPSLPPDDRGLGRLQASIAFREGRWKEAAARSIAVLRREPHDPALRAVAAESLRCLGELQRSREHWKRAVEADPRSPELRLGLAVALWDLGDYAEALAAVERARRLGADPGEADYYSALCRARLGAEPSALLPLLQDLLRKRAAERGEADPRLMFALGEALYRSGRPDLARTWFEKVLDLVPEHELSRLYLISSAESLGDEAALAPAYEGYLERYPDNAKLRREYVNLLVGRGSWDEAAVQLERSLAYADAGPRGRRLLAVCYRNAGRYQEAAAAYRDLLRSEPSSAELLVGLAFCLDRDGRTALALALLEKAPPSAKAVADPWILQGALAARTGKIEAAVDALRQAVEVEPASARAWRNLGLLYRKQGLAEFAANCLERAAAAERGQKGKGAAAAAAAARAPAPESAARPPVPETAARSPAPETAARSPAPKPTARAEAPESGGALVDAVARRAPLPPGGSGDRESGVGPTRARGPAKAGKPRKPPSRGR